MTFLSLSDSKNELAAGVVEHGGINVDLAVGDAQVEKPMRPTVKACSRIGIAVPTVMLVLIAIQCCGSVEASMKCVRPDWLKSVS